MGKCDEVVGIGGVLGDSGEETPCHHLQYFLGNDLFPIHTTVGGLVKALNPCAIKRHGVENVRIGGVYVKGILPTGVQNLVILSGVNLHPIATAVSRLPNPETRCPEQDGARIPRIYGELIDAVSSYLVRRTAVTAGYAPVARIELRWRDIFPGSHRGEVVAASSLGSDCHR